MYMCHALLLTLSACHAQGVSPPLFWPMDEQDEGRSEAEISISSHFTTPYSIADGINEEEWRQNQPNGPPDGQLVRYSPC
jgi:hypothetical protein